MKKVAKKWLAGLLTVMVMGLAGFFPQLTAYAAAGDANDGVALPANWVDDHHTYYFGEYNGKPIPWRVLKTTSNETLLLSENILADKMFNPMTGSNIWRDSSIRNYLNSTESGGFITMLPDAVKTSLVATDTTVGSVATSDKVHLLSNTEYGVLADTDKNIPIDWWLRSPEPGSSSTAHFARSNLTAFAQGVVELEFGVRPALAIDQSSPVFTSDSGNGTSTAPYLLGGSADKKLIVGDYVKFSVDGTAVTWKAIQISGDGNTATLLATTKVGTDKPFHDGVYVNWSDSEVRTFLNPPSGTYETSTFAFAAAEKSAMHATAIQENGDVLTNDKMFLLSFSEASNTEYFNDNTDRKINDKYWWLRTPYPDEVTTELVVDYKDGKIGGIGVDTDAGVRPAFNLDSPSIIFASEIKLGADPTKGETEVDDSYSAATAVGGRNYKLTLVDSNLTHGTLEIGGRTLGEAQTVAVGGNIVIDGDGGTSGTKLTYKIVDLSGTLVGFGQSAGNSTVTINATDFSGTNLSGGAYAVYVWAQKDNALSSHMGSAPQYFTLYVASETPTISGSAEDVDASENMIVYFTMDGSDETNLYGVLTVTVDDKKYTVNIVDGEGTVTIGILPVGVYTVTYTYKGNSHYLPVTGTPFTVTVTKAVINISEILGVTAPFRGATPVTEITESGQYTGTVTWSGNPTTFEANTVYTATIELTLKDDEMYTLTGVAKNFFKVSGATATNAADSGVITAKFPKTSTNSTNPGSGGGSDQPSTPTTPSKPETGDNDLTTPPGKPPVVDNNGNATLPGGGTVETPDGSKVEVPAGTTIDKKGNVAIPEGKEAEVTLPSGTEITLPGGSLIGGTGGGIAIGTGGATVNYGGIELNIREGTEITLNEDAPLGYCVSAENPFIDVKSGDWFYGDVMFAYTHGLFSGTGATTFSPNDTMTRGMLVTVLARMDGADLSGYTGSRFDDVEMGQYYTAPIEWAAENLIVSGVGEGNFAPGAPITREQFVTILYRYAKFMGIDAGKTTDLANFTDSSDVSEWAQEAMRWACGAGIVSGKPGDMLDPQGNATRAEAATILRRFVEMVTVG